VDLPVDELALYDCSTERQEMMALVTERVLEGSEPRFRLVVTRRAEAAIDGADFVIVSVRVGGQQARAVDERTALEVGCIGQETTGPAGFAYALRSIPVVEEIARLAGRLAPKAWLINFTNPAGLIAQALHGRSPVPVVGVCDSPQVIAEQIGRAAGVPVDEIDWRYTGLNHLGWVTTARHRGEELLPRLIADDGALARLVSGQLIPGSLVRHLGMVPNEYCYYYYFRTEALASQQAAGETRGELLARLERELQASLARLDPRDGEAVIGCYGRYLQAREASYLAIERQRPRDLPVQSFRDLILSGGEGYIGVALKVVAGLCGAPGRGTQRAVLSVVNYGQIVPGLGDEDVVETMCEITPKGIVPLPGPPLPPESVALLRTVKCYEWLTAEAALSGSRALAVRALTHHPLVGSFSLAEKLVDAYLLQHRAYLPRFAQEGG